MRGPIVVGVLAGLVVAALLAGLFVALALGEPTPSIAPVSPSPAADGARSPSASPNATAPASQIPGSSPGPGASPSAGASPSRTVVPSLSGSSVPAVGVTVGDLAPPLRLAQLGGSEVDTTALRGQPLWVNFMATWCPPCRDELPIMDRLQRELGDRMTIIVVDVEEDA
ncbi:MAG: redoxin family protein, partial [Chloroflexi bacterium]|nr:redoxin family protein [Chloroflexota bacterium]